jgi:flagellar motor switch protein FliG
MSNIKRFKEFKNQQLNENVETETSLKDHVDRMVNILYGMDEKYEEQIAVSYNKKTGQIRLSLDSVEECENVKNYLIGQNYEARCEGTDVFVETGLSAE